MRGFVGGAHGQHRPDVGVDVDPEAGKVGRLLVEVAARDSGGPAVAVVGVTPWAIFTLCRCSIGFARHGQATTAPPVMTANAARAAIRPG